MAAEKIALARERTEAFYRRDLEGMPGRKDDGDTKKDREAAALRE